MGMTCSPISLIISSVSSSGAGPMPNTSWSTPVHAATVPTHPPISHAAIEDSPERALRVAIDAYGRTVAGVLDRVDEITTQGAG